MLRSCGHLIIVSNFFIAYPLIRISPAVLTKQTYGNWKLSNREFRIIFAFWNFSKKEGHEFSLVFVVHEGFPTSLSCKGTTRPRAVAEYELKFKLSYQLLFSIIIIIIITITASQGNWSEYLILWSEVSDKTPDCKLVPKVRERVVYVSFEV